jgi:filamentous hemagglutinin family protein
LFRNQLQKINAKSYIKTANASAAEYVDCLIPIDDSRSRLHHPLELVSLKRNYSPVSAFFKITVFAFGYFSFAPSTLAQAVIADPTVSTQVSQSGVDFTITGGQQQGSNLFHSFSEFSIPTGGSALFGNNPEIQNIIARVTGNSVSSIDGLLQTAYPSNLFLLNPNGIIFGRQAQLEIGGSFLASTASSLKFADGFEFSATNPASTSPLLSINVPIGLQFGASAGSIQNQSIARDHNNVPVGLQVQPGKAIALVGNGITNDGGLITASDTSSTPAPGGRIELGSVSGPTFVSLISTNQGWGLDYSGVETFQDIALSGSALLNASGEGGGDIRVQGRHITVTEGAQIAALTLGSQSGGHLAITASESLEVSGTTPDKRTFSALLTEAVGPQGSDLTTIRGRTGQGSAGNITIRTPQLLVQNGAFISTSTWSEGQAGNLDVDALNGSIQVSTTDETMLTGLFAAAAAGNGSAGELTLKAAQLRVQNGAQVSVSTFSKGNAGKMSVEVATIHLTGGSGAGGNTGLFAQTTPGAQGAGGTLLINTDRLLIDQGAQIAVSSFSSGQGGDLTINATERVEISGRTLDGALPSGLFTQVNQGATGNSGKLAIATKDLVIRDGAVVSAGTRSGSSGAGGNLTVQATDSVTIAGVGKDEQGQPSPSRLLVETKGSGRAGNLNIETKNLTVRDGAEVRVGSEGSGAAGNLNVKATKLLLDRQGALTARTTSEQGNITIRAGTIQMRHGSQIATDAVGSATGGNITIDTDTLVAIPQENSDITANAGKGPGGRVTIRSQGIFGTQFRPALTADSDITATSELGPEFSGTVVIQTPDVDPSNGLVASEPEVVDPSNLVAQGCAIQRHTAGTFVITGRGGLPPSPNEVLGDQTIFSDLGKPVPSQEHAEERHNSGHLSNNSASQAIAQAEGWLVNAKGQVVLLAQAPTVTPHHPMFPSAACNAP